MKMFTFWGGFKGAAYSFLILFGLIGLSKVPFLQNTYVRGQTITNPHLLKEKVVDRIPPSQPTRYLVR